LHQRIQPCSLFDAQRLDKQVLHSSLCQTLHRPHEALERRHARRNDLLRSQPLDGCLDQRQ